jgi:hypothetical protein
MLQERRDVTGKERCYRKGEMLQESGIVRVNTTRCQCLKYSWALNDMTVIASIKQCAIDPELRQFTSMHYHTSNRFHLPQLPRNFPWIKTVSKDGYAPAILTGRVRSILAVVPSISSQHRLKQRRDLQIYSSKKERRNYEPVRMKQG